MLYYVYKVGKFIALKLPLEKGYIFATFVADVYYLFARQDRENLKYNLQIALGTKDEKLINRHIRNIFRNFTKYLLDFLRFEVLDSSYLLSHIKVDGKEKLDKAMSKGKGTILLTAHLGNWELGAAIVASFGYPFYAIALEHKDKRINDLFLRQRRSVDVKIIPIGAQIRNCFRELKRNCLLAIVGDRDFTNHGTTVDFFNRPTVLPKGPAVFSIRTGATIVPTFSIRTENNNFRIIFEEPLNVRLTGDEERDINATMRAYIPVIEKYIRAYPDQWYAFRKVWDNGNSR